MADPDSFTLNIQGVSDLIESGTNKVKSTGQINPEGATGEKIDILDLPMSDEELLALRDEYEKAYAPYEGKYKEIPKRNLRSYLGRNMRDGSLLESDMPGAANLQFESEETFLPAATAQDPSPFVFADNTPEGNKLSQSVQTMLQFHAQQLLIRRKLAVMTRQWSIHQLGVLKPGWKKYHVLGEEVGGDVAVENRKIQDYVFDPNGYVDVFGHFSSWLGERINVPAKDLMDLFPKHADYIRKEVGGKLGTEVTYTEWWTDEYCFTTFKEKVLDKHKNQYFNYPEPQMDPMTQEPMKGLDGDPVMTRPHNHFAEPQKPHIFLSVFSLQERPHDITSLIEQNIPNQNKISKRTEQIDANVSQSNNGVAFSETNFNQETAKQASNALVNGVGKVLVPQGGPINEAIVRIPAPTFPDAGFKDLENSENHLRSSWGTQGIASQQQKPDETAKGMVLNQGRDTSRIGGGIGDVLEQSVAKSVFDWLVQLYCVFYDEKHFGVVLGVGKATEYVELSAKDIDRQLVIGVASNSMKPKDQISEMNQATELFQMGAIGPKVLLETLDFANPDEAAADGVLWKIDPMAYMTLNFPEEAAKLQQLAQQQAQAQLQAQQQQQAQETQAVQQQLGHKQAEHQQKLQHGDESHKQKLQQSTEMASAKLATAKKPSPGK